MRDLGKRLLRTRRGVDRPLYEERLPPPLVDLTVVHTPDRDSTSIASLVALSTPDGRVEVTDPRSDGLVGLSVSYLPAGSRERRCIVSALWPPGRGMESGWQARLAESMSHSIVERESLDSPLSFRLRPRDGRPWLRKGAPSSEMDPAVPVAYHQPDPNGGSTDEEDHPWGDPEATTELDP